MAHLYTPQEQARVLRQLKIRASSVDGAETVTTEEVVAIWKWRTGHDYQTTAVKSCIERKVLAPVNPGHRPLRFKVDDIFHISLVPSRAKLKRRDNERATI